MKCSQPINVFEDGQQSRDFVYIDDVVQATIQGLEKHEADYQVLNVGTGERTTVLTVAQTLKQLYQADVDIKVSGRYRVGDIRHNVADLSKIRGMLSFEPRYDFREGISRFCSWVENQPITGSRYQESMQEMNLRGLYK
jgi:dTDP-L-rhamnose 4-epimerase